jgi:ribosomal protein S18 acetylase RimI-like enzyme
MRDPPLPEEESPTRTLLLRQLCSQDKMGPPPQFVLSSTFEDKDWDELFVVSSKCFESTPEIAVLSPGGLDPAHRAANIEGFKRGVFGGPAERAYAKISEVQSDKATSYITTCVYRGPKGVIDGPFAEAPPPVQLPFIQDKEDRVFYEWYWGRLRDVTRSSAELHVPHVHIQSLATDPEWQHQGAAKMLIEWVLSFAAKEKIGRCSLIAGPETSPTGFYEKFGFRAVSRHTFEDEDRFPGRVGTPVVVLIKDL